jgi:transcriptional regulator with XRE-family HTH domain
MGTTTDGAPRPHWENNQVETFISSDTAQRVIRHQLVLLRKLAGKTQKEAAAVCSEVRPTSQPHYAQFENGTVVIDQDRLVKVLAFFGAGDRAEILLKVLEIARSGTVTGQQGISMIDDVEIYLALEWFAAELAMYDTNLINGMLVPPEYARVLVDSAIAASQAEHEVLAEAGDDSEYVPPDPVAVLARRMQRQRLLWLPKPPKITVYLEERSLTGSIIDPAVENAEEINAEIMRTTLDHILAIDEQLPHLTIKVLRERFRLRATGTKPLNLVTMTDNWKLGYAPTSLSAHYFDAPEAVVRCETIMRRLDKQALDPQASRQLLERYAAA